jgi:phosphoglycerate dehydrogenase-like enzyme
MKIVVLESLGISQEELLNLAKPLTESGHEIVIYEKNTDDEVIISRAHDADIILLANMPLKSAVIRSLNHLKLISVAFTGVDHIGMDACRERGIIVCNAAGYSTHSVAELTLGLILSVYRNIVPMHQATLLGKTKAGYAFHELYGKTVGIIGTGAIGLRVAEILKVFGCKIQVYSKTKKSNELDYVTLETLLKTSDIVSLHVPLNQETRGLIGKAELEMMKPSAILINTARGPIVHETALLHALQTNQIAGAGIDVFDLEPPLPTNYPLLEAPHLTLTPHIAFATREAISRRAQIVMDNITMYLNQTPQNVME